MLTTSTSCSPDTNDFFPTSNLSIVQTPYANPPTGNRIGLSVQNALPLHTLSWLQPSVAYQIT